MNAKGFDTVEWPKSRLTSLDLGRLYKDKHIMFGLLEVDVTEVRQRPVTDEKDFTLGEHAFSTAAVEFYYALPQRVRLLLMKWLGRSTFRATRHAGTAVVTTVNAVGRSAGWILPTRNMHSTAVSIGSISKKPWVGRGSSRFGRSCICRSHSTTTSSMGCRREGSHRIS